MINHEGWDHIIPCLARDSSISKAAVELLFELLQERSGWNVSVCRKLSQQCSAILFLVTLLNSPVTESAVYAEKILNKLFEVDEENIPRAAKSGWYKPLVDRIVQGQKTIFHLYFIRFHFLTNVNLSTFKSFATVKNINSC